MAFPSLHVLLYSLSPSLSLSLTHTHTHTHTHTNLHSSMFDYPLVVSAPGWVGDIAEHHYRVGSVTQYTGRGLCLKLSVELVSELGNKSVDYKPTSFYLSRGTACGQNTYSSFPKCTT